MALELVRARAPVRICDLGGWSDTRVAGAGAVVSLCISHYAHVTVEISPRQALTIVSLDDEASDSIEALRRQQYQGVLDLARAALKRVGLHRGVRVLARTDVPPGAGLGAAASLGVALVGALCAFIGPRALPGDVAELAHSVETEEMGFECGVQDHHASARGGANLLEVDYPRARVHSIPLSVAVRCELESRLLLVHGRPAGISSDLHRKVFGERPVGELRSLFERLAECAVLGKEALLEGDVGAFGDAMNANWTLQRQLHPDVAPADFQELESVLRRAGAIAFKGNGAGGGGSATVLCGADNQHLVARQIEALGVRWSPVRLDQSGLRVWRPRDTGA